jgi:hypothetical protein
MHQGLRAFFLLLCHWMCHLPIFQLITFCTIDWLYTAKNSDSALAGIAVRRLLEIKGVINNL